MSFHLLTYLVYLCDEISLAECMRKVLTMSTTGLKLFFIKRTSAKLVDI